MADSARSRPARRPADQDSRTKLIRAIRAAARRKGMDDDDRRAFQQQLGLPTSMTAMSPAELGRLIDHLNRDWAGPSGDRIHLGKIRALWWSLYWLGEIHQPNDEALSTFIKRQTGIEHLRFLDHHKASAVIEALKSWLVRAGVEWWSAERLAAFDPRASTIEFTAAHADRHAVLAAIGAGLVSAGAVDRDFYSWVEHWLRAPPRRQWDWSATQLDSAIREFGKRLRRARERGQR